MPSIPVFQAKVQVAEAVVDDDFAHLAAYRWSLDKDSYVRRTQRSGSKTLNFVLHRVVLGLPKGEGVVDHINGDKLDNRRSNLRVVTQRQNAQNRRPLSGRGASRYRGVSFEVRRGDWRGQAHLEGTYHHIGFFSTEEEAAAAVAAWRLENMPESLQDA